MNKEKMLIFHPCLPPYRIDVFNAFTGSFDIYALLTGEKKELRSLGFDLESINKKAQFSYQYYLKGFYYGRHLVSSIYYKTIKQFNPNVLLTSELGINTIMAILFKPFFKYKLFVLIDDSPAIATSYSLCRALLRRFVVNHADGAILVHPQVKNYLSIKYAKNHCKFHFFPIIQDDQLLRNCFSAALTLSGNIFEQNNLRGTKNILYVGRLEKEKKPDLLLDIFCELYENDKNLRLIIVGDGTLATAIQAAVISKHLEKCCFLTGRLTGNDLYAWYNVGQIFVLPSQHEPFGAVVNEALVAGCKVAVSDSVGANCLIDKENGGIFETNNKEELKRLLSDLLRETPYLHEIAIKKNKMNKSFDEYFLKLIAFISNT